MSEGNTGLTFRELLMEVRAEVHVLNQRIDKVEGRMVTKTDIDHWREIKQTTRRWAITTIISFLAIMVTVAGIIAATH